MHDISLRLPHIRPNRVLSKSDIPLPSVMEELASHGKVAGYLVPTDVGMGKNILDAHASLRSFLKERGIHDFEKQPQGTAHKKLIEVSLVGSDKLTPTKMSLYRPETKGGDPRMWIYGLNNYAHPWNLLALIEDKGRLNIVNASDSELFSTKDRRGSPLEILLRRESVALDAIAMKLLERLSEISRMGWINSMRSGPTGVGMTLETLLGIQANPNRDPDYDGIEIKASRVRGRLNAVNNRVSLFSQVPDWDISKCKSGKEILLAHGYIDRETGRRQLYVTNCHYPNSQGLFLTINASKNLLESVHGTVTSHRDVAVWSLDRLRMELEKKHQRTFWVKAKTRRNGTGGEAFHYYEVEETKTALSINIVPLIETGIVTIDYTLSQIGNGRAKNHGYLFKIRPGHFKLLFPPSVKYAL